MTYRIVPMAPDHIGGFREAMDAIVRESRMFSFFEAPPLEQVTDFVTRAIRDDEAQFVAIADDAVVGWCDALRKPRPGMRHSAVLGIGVLRSHRGQGVGSDLIETTLNAANAKGLTRIELHVRTDNERAIKLYKRFGFEVEGVQRRHILADDVYHDSYLMSLLYE